MKTFWAIVILALGGYAVHEHSKAQSVIGNAGPGTGADSPASQGIFRGKWAVPRGKNTVSRIPPGLRYSVPANGYPNQGGAFKPTPVGYQPPSGPDANQNGCFGTFLY